MGLCKRLYGLTILGFFGVTVALSSVSSPMRCVQVSSFLARDVKAKPPQGPSKDFMRSKGTQDQRLHEEWSAVDHCRAMKRASEVRRVNVSAVSEMYSTCVRFHLVLICDCFCTFFLIFFWTWYWNARQKRSMVPASPNFICHFLREQFRRD